jgi:hypothetical protein
MRPERHFDTPPLDLDCAEPIGRRCDLELGSPYFDDCIPGQDPKSLLGAEVDNRHVDPPI